jgi:hypothetical protein
VLESNTLLNKDRINKLTGFKGEIKMPRGNNLQEMDAKNPQSKTAVNSGAKPAEPMPKLTTGIAPGQTGSWEDLGGPTPENYKNDDDSAKFKDPAGRISQVKDVVNRGAKAAEPTPHLASGAVKESLDDEDEELLEDEELEEGDEDEEDEELEEGEDEEVYEEEINIDEDVDALMEGEELSEEFQEKARTIFEAALKTRAAQLKEALEAQYESALLEEVESIKAELEERVDSYLEYVAEEWLEENRLQVETGIKVKVAESFLEGLKGLCEQHYVQMPEEKYDVLEGMVEKLDEMEEKLNEQIEKNIRLNQRLSESVADRILDEVSEGLAATQKEKLATLVESVEFESEQTYRGKLETLRESYFPTRRVAQHVVTETLSEGYDYSPESVSDSMSQYLRAADMFRKN